MHVYRSQFRFYFDTVNRLIQCSVSDVVQRKTLSRIQDKQPLLALYRHIYGAVLSTSTFCIELNINHCDRHAY